ncbi:HSP20-like chaperone [Sphaerosporella brunnea]|uniref:HSP20-like chaperone n=1 Tax=Sphaerosporella brunnea TaxID=1250544 RepID=A0A5J5EFH4_9PEZI|nr:HSP20-like chaperone [Sphaerosporella brunnea]
MPFFPRFHYPENTSPVSIFPTDILRMLEDFETPTTAAASQETSRRAFSPNFDVHETEHEYILEGELPGLSDKKNISIEFTDDKTILISGKIERSVKKWTDETGQVKTIEGGEEQKKIEEGEKKEVEQKEGDKGKQVQKGEKRETRPKFWLSERSVGEFQRSFSFPTRVDIDRVKASLENGILRIAVPKLEKKVGKKIEVQ